MSEFKKYFFDEYRGAFPFYLKVFLLTIEFSLVAFLIYSLIFLPLNRWGVKECIMAGVLFGPGLLFGLYMTFVELANDIRNQKSLMYRFIGFLASILETVFMAILVTPIATARIIDRKPIIGPL